MAKRRQKPHIIGLLDMVDMFGMDRPSVQNWRVRNQLPEPLRVIGKSPVWEYWQIEEWAKDTGREIKQPIPYPVDWPQATRAKAGVDEAAPRPR